MTAGNSRYGEASGTPAYPRRNLDAGLAGGRLSRSGMVRMVRYFRSLWRLSGWGMRPPGMDPWKPVHGRWKVWPASVRDHAGLGLSEHLRSANGEAVVVGRG